MSLFQEACGSVGPLKVSIQHADRPTDFREFAQPFLVIGREPKSDLPLSDPTINYRHAYFQVLAGQVYCLDLFTRTGLRWGSGTRTAGWLNPDQPLGIGPYTVQFVNAPHPDLAQAADPLASRSRDQDPLPRVNLEILLENQTVVWPMNRVLALVGQEPRCKVHLKAAGVSSVHCSLVRTPKGLFVVDLNSSTGTMRNGSAVRWACLEDGDELRVGDMRLRVIYPATHNSAATLTPPSGVFIQAFPEEEKLRTQLEELSRTLTAAEDDRAGLIRASEEATRRWEAERDTLRTEHDAERKRSEGELAALRAKADEDHQRHVAEVDALRDQLAQRDQATRTEADFEQQRQALREEVDRLKQEADSQRAECEQVTTQFTALQEEVNRLKQEADGLRADRDEATTQLAVADADRDTLRAEAAVREQQLQRELTAAREEVEKLRREHDEAVSRAADAARQVTDLQAERQRAEDDRAKADQDRDRALQTLRDELAAAQKQYDAATDDAAKRLREREDELAAARRDFDRERQVLHTEADNRRRAELDEQKAQAAAREREYEGELQSLRDELAGLRQELTTREQQAKANLAAVQAHADEDRRGRTAEVESQRQASEALRQELTTARNQLAALQQQVGLTSANGSDPAVAKLTEQFRAATERFNGLVDQIEGLYGELRERSRHRVEPKRGVFARFLGGSREDEAETNAAVERRLATVQAETAIEQERAARLASDAARADLEARLDEARRQLQALNKDN